MTTGLIIVTAVICFTPPLLHLAGFGVLGPVKGKCFRLYFLSLSQDNSRWPSRTARDYYLFSSSYLANATTGSLAAWAQGTFYGGIIPSGSLFSMLQHAGMVMGGSIGDIICALAPLFGFAVGWMLKLFIKPVQP
jgi:hypothetical protein